MLQRKKESAPVPDQGRVFRGRIPMPHCRSTAVTVSSSIFVLSIALLATLLCVPGLHAQSSVFRNTDPSVAAGNWSWRAPEGSWTPELASRLAAIAEVTDRDNDPLGEPEKEETE